MAQRAERARNGSRRQRDREALLELQRDEEIAQLHNQLAGVQLDQRADEAWAKASERLADAIPEVSHECYIAPLEVLGRRGDELWVTARSAIVAWTERRYGALISKALLADGWTPRFVATEDLP